MYMKAIIYYRSDKRLTTTHCAICIGSAAVEPMLFVTQASIQQFEAINGIAIFCRWKVFVNLQILDNFFAFLVR